MNREHPGSPSYATASPLHPHKSPPPTQIPAPSEPPDPAPSPANPQTPPPPPVRSRTNSPRIHFPPGVPDTTPPPLAFPLFSPSFPPAHAYPPAWELTATSAAHGKYKNRDRSPPDSDHPATLAATPSAVRFLPPIPSSAAQCAISPNAGKIHPPRPATPAVWIARDHSSSPASPDDPRQNFVASGTTEDD